MTVIDSFTQGGNKYFNSRFSSGFTAIDLAVAWAVINTLAASRAQCSL